MSCTYYLRDKKITNKTVKELDLLEKNFNIKLENLYNELNEKIANILPINNKNVIEECRQYEPDYRNETRFYLDSINKLDFGVYTSGNFRFRRFGNLNEFVKFYEENKDKYIIVDEYNEEFTLDNFLKEVKLK